MTPPAGADGPSGLGARGAPGEYSSAIRVPSGDQRGVDSGPFAAVTIARAAGGGEVLDRDLPLAAGVGRHERQPPPVGRPRESPSSHLRPGHAVIVCATLGRATSASRIALRSPSPSTYANRRPSGESATCENWCTPPSAAAI